MKRFVRFLLVLFAAATLAAAPSTAKPPQLIDLGTLGGSSTLIEDLNNRGQVVGMSSLTGGPLWGAGGFEDVRAFLWEKGEMINLGTGGGISSRAVAISDSGKITGDVGFSESPLQLKVFLWENGVMTVLEGLGGLVSTAADINNRGQIVGRSAHAQDEYEHAVIWQNGTVTSLETPGELFSVPFAINESGQVLVVWWQDYADPNTFVWKNGQRSDLGTLGGCCTYAQNQSDSGLVAGRSSTASGEDHAFLWKNGEMTDLGTPPGRHLGNVTGVNNAGQVLVNGWAEGLPLQAFVWERGAYRPLETPAGMHSHASGINEKGQVYGSVITVDGSERLAAVWDNKGKLAIIGGLSETINATIDINSRGQVIGWSEADNFTYRSFIWNGK